MNYGVCVSNDGGSDFFGILDDVIELKFTGALRQYNTILFKCNWMDNVRGMNIDQYKLVEVNHTKKYPKFDPFVLSYQVSQVYFAPYPSLKRDRAQWWAVFRTKARSVIDAPVDFDFLQETSVGTPTLSDPSDIPDYEEGNDVECVQADDEDILFEVPSGDDEEESSFESGDSEDDDDEDDGFWDDDSDDELSEDGNSL